MLYLDPSFFIKTQLSILISQQQLPFPKLVSRVWPSTLELRIYIVIPNYRNDIVFDVSQR
uniref:Uncharacterized protein n=1 Tax=Picea glauca TaxID=3330 RepID=A0A101M422_PICGL|nr:hypothetical protein ABT39_MTgene545 [Picea glauca]